jgi:hypothetical protein
MPEAAGAGIPLGVATALLELDLSQLDRAERQVQNLVQRIRGLQDQLTEGNDQLAASARQVTQNLSRANQGGGTRQRQSTAQQAQTMASATRAAAQAESQRAQAANQTASAEAKVTQQLQEQTNQLQRQSAIQDRLAAAARVRAARETSTSFVGNLRQAAFGGGAVPAGGAGGFGRGNPNIPTFAQFGLFPFAGLAGTFGATGLQQGLMGASSALGVAELGSFRNAIVRLADQLRGLGGVFGSLANLGARAAGALGASSGGLVASLASIGTVVAPILAAIGGIALLNNAIEQFQQKVEEATNNIIKNAEEIAAGQTSADIRTGIADQQRRQGVLERRRQEIETLLADAEEARRTAVGTPSQRQAAVAPFNQRARELTGGAITEAVGIGAFMLQRVLAGLDEEINDLAVSIALDVASLDDAEVAANDAAEAARNLAEAQLEAAESARGLTNAQIDDKIGELENRFQSILAVLNGGIPISEEYQQELRGELDEINRIQNALRGMKSPMRDFSVFINGIIEELPDFLKQRNQLIEDRNLRRGREAEDLELQTAREAEDTQRQRLRQIEDFGKQLQQEDADRARQRGQQIEDFERSLAEMEAESRDRVLELTEDYNEDREDAEAEHQRRLAQIAREGRIAVLEAASRLDARGVIETQRRVREQLRQEQENFDDQEERRQEAFEEALEELDDNLAEQQARRRADFERQLARQDQEFAITRQRRVDEFFRNLQREDQERQIRAQREEQDRQIRAQREREDFNRQLTDLLAHYANLNQATNAFYSFFRQGWQNFLNGLMPTAQTQTNTGGTGVFGGSTRPFLSPSFASGTPFVSGTGFARVHYGERILSAAENRRFMTGQGGASISIGQINVNAGNLGEYSPQEAQQIVSDGILDALLREMAINGLSDLNGGG